MVVRAPRLPGGAGHSPVLHHPGSRGRAPTEHRLGARCDRHVTGDDGGVRRSLRPPDRTHCASAPDSTGDSRPDLQGIRDHDGGGHRRVAVPDAGPVRHLGPASVDRRQSRSRVEGRLHGRARWSAVSPVARARRGSGRSAAGVARGSRDQTLGVGSPACWISAPRSGLRGFLPRAAGVSARVPGISRVRAVLAVG